MWDWESKMTSQENNPRHPLISIWVVDLCNGRVQWEAPKMVMSSDPIHA